MSAKAASPPDFFVALKCVERGFRVVEDVRVKAYYKITKKHHNELIRKVRTINRGMHALFSNAALLNVFTYGFKSVELICHKLLRWCTPFFLVTLFFSNIIIQSDSAVISLFLLLQTIFYCVMLIAVLRGGNNRQFRLIRLLRFFFLTNMAICVAWYKFLTGRKYVMWQPTKR